jgi:hypothetical protein
MSRILWLVVVIAASMATPCHGSTVISVQLQNSADDTSFASSADDDELPEEIRVAAPTFGRDSVTIVNRTASDYPTLPKNSLRAPKPMPRIIGGNEAGEDDYDFFGAYRRRLRQLFHVYIAPLTPLFPILQSNSWATPCVAPASLPLTSS